MAIAAVPHCVINMFPQGSWSDDFGVIWVGRKRGVLANWEVEVGHAATIVGNARESEEIVTWSPGRASERRASFARPSAVFPLGANLDSVIARQETVATASPIVEKRWGDRRPGARCSPAGAAGRHRGAERNRPRRRRYCGARARDPCTGDRRASCGSARTAFAGARPVSCPSCGFENTLAARFCGGFAPVVREAERREACVLFCDLVGSTALSHQLDAEHLRDLIGLYDGGAVREAAATPDLRNHEANGRLLAARRTPVTVDTAP